MCGILLHPTVEDFLRSTSSPTKIDEATSWDAVRAAAADEVPEIALREKPPGTAIDSLEAGQIRIAGYATPKPSVVAVAFEAPFTFIETTYDEDNAYRERVNLTLDGVCSYDPESKQVSGR